MIHPPARRGKIAPRKSVRFPARIEVRLAGGRDTVFCQTENLSKTGALLHTDRSYDKGTRLTIELRVGEDDKPLMVVAEVVRSKTSGRDRIAGIAVRFVSFHPGAERRLHDYLDRDS